ncbi:unnamed protein product [Mucor hiemalis]
MRIFWYNTESQDPLTLLHDTQSHSSFKGVKLSPRNCSKNCRLFTKSSLPSIAGVSQIWYATVMPMSYRHLYIRTYPHWLLLTRTMSDSSFAFKNCVSSLVLKPSPRLISAQLTSYLNQSVVANDDTLQPGTRGYVRVERVNYDLTGLETIDVAMDEENREQQGHENYREMDDTTKEYEWLTLVNTKQVVDVIRECPALEYLHLSGCENLTDGFLTELARCKASNLTVSKPMKGIWISLLRNLTSNDISSLVQFEEAHFEEKKLRHLDIGYNINITPKTMEHIARCWGPTLTHFRLDTLYELTNATIGFIAKHSPNLVLLHLTRCWNISTAGLRSLATYCKRLKYVSLAFLGQVNEDGVRLLVQVPSIIWLDISGCGINPLFKRPIMESFVNYRKQHSLPPIYFQDSTVNLI